MKKITILYGGESSEREVSINTGKAIETALKSRAYDVHLLDWNNKQIPDFIQNHHDAVFIALHGGCGENGQIQAFLEMQNIPYTGSNPLTSALCMDKQKSKQFLKNDIPLPPSITLSRSEAQALLNNSSTTKHDHLTEKLPLPWVIKPSEGGSSCGITLVKNNLQIDQAIKSALKEPGQIIIEKYIKGHELTVAILNQKALGVCEIIPHNNFYDYEAKYLRNDTQYLVPSTFSPDFENKLCKLSEKIANLMDCKGAVRIDFLVDDNHNPYFLEVNTVPGMTEKSLVPKIAKAAGMSFPELCEQILKPIL